MHTVAFDSTVGSMWQFAVSFLQKPDWVAAVALSLQVVILYLQWRILRKHHEVMKQQVHTAEKIDQTIRQQGQILDDQFKFQKRVEEKDERVNAFDITWKLSNNVRALLDAYAAIPPRGPVPPTLDDTVAANQRIAWYRVAVSETAEACYKVWFPSIHIQKDVSVYFLNYIREVIDALDKPDVPYSLRRVEESRKDFMAMLLNIATSPAPF